MWSGGADSIPTESPDPAPLAVNASCDVSCAQESNRGSQVHRTWMPRFKNADAISARGALDRPPVVLPRRVIVPRVEPGDDVVHELDIHQRGGFAQNPC